MNKHRAYSWPALNKEDYLLIGDSLVKFVNRAKYMRVLAFPGATARTILEKFRQGQIDSRFHQIVLLAIGSNDICDMARSPREIMTQIMEVIDTIRASNEWAMIAFSGMLIRPKDIGTSIENRRKHTNKLIEWACKTRGVYYMRSWKSLLNGSFLKDRVYARDGLHLNRFGARFLYRYMEGSLKQMEGLMKL
jgi:lysophospholipase L1-like esterase